MELLQGSYIAKSRDNFHYEVKKIIMISNQILHQKIKCFGILELPGFRLSKHGCVLKIVVNWQGKFLFGWKMFLLLTEKV